MPVPPDLEDLLALLPLAELPRTGWLQAGLPPGVAPETIAGHAHLVALLALRLAPVAGASPDSTTGSASGPAYASPSGPASGTPLDAHRAVAIAVAHDAAEAFTGDLPRPATAGLGSEAKHTLEAGLFAAELPELAPLAAEYRAGSSPEARFVRLCDKLQLGLFALRLARAGHTGLASFAASVEAADTAEFPGLEPLRTALAQELSSACRS